jgi:hypothetical protein
MKKWIAGTAVLGAAALVSSCSSSGHQTSGTGPATRPASSVPSSTGAAAVTPAEIASMMQAGVAGVSSAHLTWETKAGDEVLLAMQGNERLSAGKVIAMDLTETLAGDVIRMLVVDGRAYVNVVSGPDATGMTWILASPTSKNPTLKSLAGSIASAQQSGAADTYGVFVLAARSAKKVGTEQIAGQPTTRYTVTVDLRKVHSRLITTQMRQAMAEAGISTIPLDLWLDDHGRPLKVVDVIAADGQRATNTVTLTKYNEPVTITAPPAADVVTTE